MCLALRRSKRGARRLDAATAAAVHRGARFFLELEQSTIKGSASQAFRIENSGEKGAKRQTQRSEIRTAVLRVVNCVPQLFGYSKQGLSQTGRISHTYMLVGNCCVTLR